MNAVKLTGVLARDPEIKPTKFGNVCNFSIKTQEEHPATIKVVAWDACAEALRGLKAGTAITVQASLRNRKRENPDGSATWSLEVVADSKSGGVVMAEGAQPPADEPSLDDLGF